MINDAFSTCLEWSCPHRTVITHSQAAAAQHNCFLFVDLVYWGERWLWLGATVLPTVYRDEDVCNFKIWVTPCVWDPCRLHTCEREDVYLREWERERERERDRVTQDIKGASGCKLQQKSKYIQLWHAATYCQSGNTQICSPPTSGQRQPQTSCARLPHTSGIRKYSTCTVKEGCALSCIIYVNISKAAAPCCSENSKQSSEGQWNTAPTHPPSPLPLWLHA